MTTAHTDVAPTQSRRRQWLLGLDPIFEAKRSGKNATTWDVEDELVAVALLGDVTIDLSQARTIPREVTIDAYAVLRDVTVVVPDGTHVELDGGRVWGDITNEAPPASEQHPNLAVYVHGHTVAGDVTVRTNTQ